MRHAVRIKKLGRTQAHRKALLMNLSLSILKHEKFTTTFVKAKALQRFLEPLITRAKVDSTANRRLVFAKLRHKALTEKLFSDIAPRFKERPGGYTRVLKLYNRKGDDALMAYMELVEEEITTSNKKQANKPAIVEKSTDIITSPTQEEV